MACAAPGPPASQPAGRPAGQSACLPVCVRVCDSQQIKIIAKKVEKFRRTGFCKVRASEQASQPTYSRSRLRIIGPHRTAPPEGRGCVCSRPDGWLTIGEQGRIVIRSHSFRFHARRETHRDAPRSQSAHVRIMRAPTIHRATKFARLGRRAKEKERKGGERKRNKEKRYMYTSTRFTVISLDSLVHAVLSKSPRFALLRLGSLTLPREMKRRECTLILHLLLFFFLSMNFAKIDISIT